MWDTAKDMLERKSIVSNAYVRKGKNMKHNDLKFLLKELIEEQKIKPKESKIQIIKRRKCMN